MKHCDRSGRTAYIETITPELKRDTVKVTIHLDVVINIGSGVGTSVRQLVKHVVEVSGVEPEVIENPKVNPGVSAMIADLKLAREKLGYHPRFNLEEGLRLTLDRDPRFRREKTP